eukprot:2798803-Pleurochrysis_carterae.AAC.1
MEIASRRRRVQGACALRPLTGVPPAGRGCCAKPVLRRGISSPPTPSLLSPPLFIPEDGSQQRGVELVHEPLHRV